MRWLQEPTLYGDPRRLVNLGNPGLMLTNNANAALLEQFWYTVFVSAPTDFFFPNLDLVDYNSLRASCRYFARWLDPFNPGLDHNPNAAQRLVSGNCQNQRLGYRTTAAQNQNPRPRTFGRAYYPAGGILGTVGTGPCPNTINHVPRLSQVANGQFYVPYMRVCAGTRLGLNVATASRPVPHDARRLVCQDCACNNYYNEKFTDWIGEHKLPLCFECSTTHYSKEWLFRQPRWDKYCECSDRHRPSGRGGEWLCDDCRVAWVEQKCQEWRQKLIDSGQARRDPATDTTGYGGLREFIHDGDFDDRNRCRCGMSYPQMRQALPISNVQDVDSCTIVGGLDHRYTFRECLDCGGHRTDPSDGLNKWGVNQGLVPQELTCI
jgi:hypothetical protein